MISWVYERFDSVLQTDTDLRVPCPFCEARIGHEDGDHHLYISIVKNAVHCFRCEYSASHVGLIMDIDACSYGHAAAQVYRSTSVLASQLDELCQRGLWEDDVDAVSATRVAIDDMPSEFIPFTEALKVTSGYISKACDLCCKYLRQRGILDEAIYYGLGMWNHAAGYGLIVIPIERGFWQERSVFPRKPKYMSPKMPKEDRLFNWRALDLYDSVIITEGALSAMSISGRNAVALIGKDATEEQIARLIKAKPTHYIVALDADATSNALKLADRLYRAGKAVNIRQYAYGDPNSCNKYHDMVYGWSTRIAMMLSQHL